jgi:tetratricopeptide (TPR) repeat protein
MSIKLGPQTIKWIEQNCKEKLFSKNYEEILQKAVLGFPLEQKQQLQQIVSEMITNEHHLLALQLINKHQNIWDQNDLDCLQLEGITAMLSAELDLAKKCFYKILEYDPKDLAASSNLAKIFLQEEDQEQAWKMCMEGLKINKNHPPIWEIIWVVLQKKPTTAIEKLKSLGKEFNSWVAQMLYCELEHPAEHQKKLEILNNFYNQGESSCAFLVEYTGTLGDCDKFEEIQTVLWKHKEQLEVAEGWKLKIHQAYSFLALDRKDEYKETIIKLQKNPHVPQEIANTFQLNI